jgi:hypothetical protein
MIPARAEKTPARPPTPSSPRWSSAVTRPGSSVSRPVSSEKRRVRPTIPTTRPAFVRVDRIFKSSALN